MDSFKGGDRPSLPILPAKAVAPEADRVQAHQAQQARQAALAAMEARLQPPPETGAAGRGAEPPKPVTTEAARRWPFALEFTGTGGEYFRIWLVNLLLTAVTFGAYFPRAQARRYEYFRANTWVVFADGERHAMAFSADSGKSARAIGSWMALAIGLVILKSIAAPLVLLAGIALTPWLKWKSLRYQILGTTWRGLRFRFDGGLGPYLMAWWPMLIPLALSAIAIVTASRTGGRGSAIASLGLPLAVAVAIWPWVHWRVVRWRQQHLRYGPVVVHRFTSTVMDFYRLAFHTALVALLPTALAGLAVWAIWPGRAAFNDYGVLLTMAFVIIPILLVAWIVITASAGTYYSAGVHNLAWGGTQSVTVRLRARLGPWRLVRLQLFNGLLTAITLGLYRPFADVSVARLRLEAIDGALREDPNTLMARAVDADGAMGDLAAELLDVGAAL